MSEENLFRLLRRSTPQIIAVFFGTLNALSDGMHFGWSAPTIPLLLREDRPVEITKDDIMKLEVIYMISGMVGLPITIFLADRIGRQKSVLLASATSLIGWILICVGDTVTYFIVARFLVGAAADVAFVCSPMYVAEVAHQKIRGFLASIIYTMVLAGVFLIYSIAPFVSIRVPPIVGGSILIVQLLVFPFMPESPYYHLYKNDEVAARRSLKRLRGTDDIDDELKEITAAITRQKAERGRPQDLILMKQNRRALLIMFILNGVQHMVGFTAILMNLHTILDEAGATYIDSNFSAILFAGVMCLASILAMLLIDRFGRKTLYCISCVFAGICLLIIGLFYNLKYTGMNVNAVAWIPLVFIMIYAAFFKFGIGIVPIVMTAELFSAKVKAMGMTAADGFYVIFAGLSIYVYQTLFDIFGLQTAFYLWSAFAFSGSVINIFMIPETKGKTLEEIQIMLQN